MNQSSGLPATIRLVCPSSLAADADFPPPSSARLDLLLHRSPCRLFDVAELRLYMLSRLLRAGFGYHLPQEPGRTAPSCQEKQAIVVYAAMVNGLFRYAPSTHVLLPVLGEDIRAQTGDQQFVASAPLDLVFVANLDGLQGGSRVEHEFYAALDTGCISQNIYLFCAAEGLGTVARATFDRIALGKAMKLGRFQTPILAQSVGYAGRMRA